MNTDFFMKTKYDESELAAAAERIHGGEPIKDVLADTGMSYSPVWCYATWSRNLAEGRLIDLTELSESEADKVIANLRDEGNSWGDIACLVSRTENSCRRSYERVTNVRSEGTRIGHGGRFLADEERLYRGGQGSDDRSTHGPRLEVGTTVSEALATLEDLSSLTVKELRSIAQDAGYEGVSKLKKAQLLELLAD